MGVDAHPWGTPPAEHEKNPSMAKHAKGELTLFLLLL